PDDEIKNNCHMDCSNERLEFGELRGKGIARSYDDIYFLLSSFQIFSNVDVTIGEAESKPKDGEMVLNSMSGQEDDGEIKADEPTPESSFDKLKNDGNDEAGFKAEEATIDDIPTATTMTAI
nr:hypothetical protein [Tanacetum cinerariifolium]